MFVIWIHLKARKEKHKPWRDRPGVTGVIKLSGSILEIFEFVEVM